MKTGKVLLDDKFQNIHWNSNSDVSTSQVSNPEDAKQVDKMDVSADVEFDVDDAVPSTSSGSNMSNADVNRIFAEIENLNTFTSLQEYFNNIDENEFPSLVKPIKSVKRNVKIDRVAHFSMLNDAPKNLVPVHTVGDGNCLPRAVSTSVFGNESKHREIRLRILMECVKNKQIYLDDAYLRIGATHIHKWGTFPQQYALFSGQYIHAGFGNINDIVEIIYEKEIVTLKNDGAFMGMWQLWALTNILGRPIRSIFPHCGSTEFHADFN